MENTKSRTRRVWTLVIAAILVGIVAVNAVLGSYLCNFAFSSSSDALETIAAKYSSGSGSDDAPAVGQGFIKSDFFDVTDYETVTINASQDGVGLSARKIENPASDAWVIVIHGYGSDGSSMAGYAEKFYDMGYNVLTPDLRGNGASGGDYFGMGWLDRLDIIDWINYLDDGYSSPNIVLFGVSMGGATVMMTTGETIPSNVVAAVEDCGYSSVYAEMKYCSEKFFKIPSFPLINFTGLFTKLRAGYNIVNDGDCVSAVRRSVTPTLFIHGDADTFVPYSMLSEVYDACGAERQKLVAPSAQHGQSAVVDPETYWNTVAAFLNRYVSYKTDYVYSDAAA